MPRVKQIDIEAIFRRQTGRAIKKKAYITSTLEYKKKSQDDTGTYTTPKSA